MQDSDKQELFNEKVWDPCEGGSVIYISWETVVPAHELLVQVNVQNIYFIFENHLSKQNKNNFLNAKNQIGNLSEFRGKS